MNVPRETTEAVLARLLHRWFVQYNPLYLASAALVLVGLTLLSDGLDGDASLSARLVVPAASELYAFALIAGAALLVRRGLPRPAVFVALLAVLYQGDLTLGTEHFALMGPVGGFASAAWLVLFVVKQRALAWALRLSLSRSAVRVATLGALGLAIVPHLARRVDGGTLASIVALWLFVTLDVASATERAVDSRVPLDAWGATVLRRSLRATWSIWAALLAAHVLFWIHSSSLDPRALVPAMVLLLARRVKGELARCAIVVATWVFVARTSPAHLSAAAFMGGLVFARHAIERRSAHAPAAHDPIYRGGHDDRRSSMRVVTRDFAWTAYALHLAVWTAGHRGSALPPHLLALDVALAIAVVTLAIVLRSRTVLLPLGGGALHAAATHGLVRAPRSTLEWGATALSAGFLLLVVSLFASHELEKKGRLDDVAA